MFSTYRWNGTLIVVSPTSPRLFKFRFTWTAMAILALSCLVSFAVVVALGYSFPPLITDREHILLEQENRDLKVENLNLSIGAARVEARVSRLEGQSRQIVELMKTE